MKEFGEKDSLRPFGLLLLDTDLRGANPVTCSQSERESSGGQKWYKVEIGSQAGTSAELADISHITSGACSPEGDAVLSTDTPAALPYWPRLSHMPAYE